MHYAWFFYIHHAHMPTYKDAKIETQVNDFKKL